RPSACFVTYPIAVMIFSFGFASRTVPLAMPDRSSAETALNPLAATPVKDPKGRLFWSVSAREELRSGGEKSRA
ncbi:MAG: hypothetical protein K8F90_11965, partial [Hyphomicrobiales bacterium]|nr:hypothetical protein [Hyphomicrobiales bacterium]